MQSGLLSIRKRIVKTAEIASKEKEKLRGGSAAFFNRHSSLIPEDATVVVSERSQKMKSYDKFLKGFRYGEALDATLVSPIQAAVVQSMLDELFHRDAIRLALSGRDESSLEPILGFIHKFITYPQHQLTLINVLNVLLGRL
jgi:U3 small nucleolar RNA-associated protein 15